MLVGKPFPFVKNYVEQLSEGLDRRDLCKKLTAGQQVWLAYTLMCILITESVCWRKFVRAGLGKYSEALLSWYFRHPMSWDFLIAISVKNILKSFNTWEGVLVLDDTGKKRSKVTKRIPYIHYFKDKESTGTIRGQEVIFLVLVTPLVTIPVAFAFYQPDPNYSKWSKEEKRLIKKGVPKSQRPSAPTKNQKYLTKQELALNLLKQFAQEHPEVTIKAILADALYGSAEFMKQATILFGGTQVVSQLRNNQKVTFKGRSWSVEDYFKSFPGVPQKLNVRGGSSVNIIMNSARLFVEAQGKKCFVIAIRYQNETEYRYLVASVLSWRTLDIADAYTLRWLVEVFIEDLKVREGWGQSTKQPGEDGSSRSLILSLLCDHCLLFHPDQQARVKRQEPLFTIGSLQRRLQIDSLLVWLQEWIGEERFSDKFEQLTDAIRPIFPLEPSKKHMSGRSLGRLEPTPSLNYIR